jgi:hypothetical protein
MPLHFYNSRLTFGRLLHFAFSLNFVLHAKDLQAFIF